MDANPVADRIGCTSPLLPNDIETLEKLSLSLPVGWQPAVDRERMRWFGLLRSVHSTNALPAVLLLKSDTGYLVVVWDTPSLVNESSSNSDEYEIFECETIEKAMIEVRSLICELMRTENPGPAMPSEWTCCLQCDPQGADCPWIKPRDDATNITSGQGSNRQNEVRNSELHATAIEG